MLVTKHGGLEQRETIISLANGLFERREKIGQNFFNRPLSLVIRCIVSSILWWNFRSLQIAKIYFLPSFLIPVIPESEYLFYILFVKKKSLFIRILETFICINVFFNVTCCLLNHSFRIRYIFILLYFIFHLCVALNFKLDVSKFLIRNYASFIFIFISFVCIYLKIIITTWHFQISSFAVYKRSF